MAPLPLYAMLKLAAYADRRKLKDLNGFLHCARYYEDVEESERRYGLEHAGEMTPLEFGGAFLLGLDGVPYQEPSLRERLGSCSIGWSTVTARTSAKPPSTPDACPPTTGGGSSASS